MKLARSVSLVSTIAIAVTGCSRARVPFDARLAALERGEMAGFVFSDLLDVPYVRDCLKTIDDSQLPKRFQPVAGRFARLVSPRGNSLETNPRFTWLAPDPPANHYQLVIWQGEDDGPGAVITTETVEGDAWQSPIPLTRGNAYYWSILDAERGAGAQVPFVVADESLTIPIRTAADALERSISERSTRLFLQTNLFESRGFFGEASVRLLELWRLHPKSAYLEKRAHRFSLYLVFP
ncbi:MAG: hypothetical protein HYR85_25310 [Planctomycetes bacterium]|nr:hypothetical protein [Planctomycetota bacterium]